MKFNDFINESLPQPEGGNLDINIIDFVLRSLQFSVQTHVYHLLTKSYAEHMAIGDFYDCLRDSADSLTETSIGMGLDTISTQDMTPLVFKYDKIELVNELSSFRSLCSTLLEMTNTSELMSINDILIKIQAAVDTLMYKLKFN